MKHLIEPFTTRKIFKEVPDTQTLGYYDDDNDLVAEVLLNDTGEWRTIKIYHEALEDEKIVSELDILPFVQQAQQIFGSPHHQLGEIQHWEEQIFARLYLHEPQYGVQVTGSGIDLLFDEAGRLFEVIRDEEDVNIHYPHTLISKEHARSILQNEQLVRLNIMPEKQWQFVYSHNERLHGVLADGTVQWIQDLPELQDAQLIALPDVAPIENFEQYLLGDRRGGEIEFSTQQDIQFWQIDCEEIELAISEDGFQRACRVVKHLVGSHYQHYYLQSIPSLEKVFDQDDSYTTLYRFIYKLEDDDITFEFFPIVVEVDKQTNQITYVEWNQIPFEKMSKAPKPQLSLQQANAIAQQLVDVELMLVRNNEHEPYYFIYTPIYPQSPTGGMLNYIDGNSGNVRYINDNYHI